jgi:hypothetical protein
VRRVDVFCVAFLAVSVLVAAAYLGEIMLAVVVSAWGAWLLWKEVQCTEVHRYPYRQTWCRNCGDPISRKRQRRGKTTCVGCQMDADERHALNMGLEPYRGPTLEPDDHTVKPHLGWGPFSGNHDGLD